MAVSLQMGMEGSVGLYRGWASALANNWSLILSSHNGWLNTTKGSRRAARERWDEKFLRAVQHSFLNLVHLGQDSHSRVRDIIVHRSQGKPSAVTCRRVTLVDDVLPQGAQSRSGDLL